MHLQIWDAPFDVSTTTIPRAASITLDISSAHKDSQSPTSSAVPADESLTYLIWELACQSPLYKSQSLRRLHRLFCKSLSRGKACSPPDAAELMFTAGSPQNLRSSGPMTSPMLDERFSLAYEVTGLLSKQIFPSCKGCNRMQFPCCSTEAISSTLHVRLIETTMYCSRNTTP